MSRTPSAYGDLLQRAVDAAASGEHAAATEALRTAMRMRFDQRIARALDLLQVAEMRREPRVSLAPVLDDLLATETQPTSESSAASDSDLDLIDVIDMPDLGNVAVPERRRAQESTAPQAVISDEHERSTLEIDGVSLHHPPAPRFLEDHFDELKRALDLGEHHVVHAILERAPMQDRNEEWREVRERNREAWTIVLERRLTPLERVPLPAVDDGDVHSHELDARTMFLLAQVDGYCTLADLIDLSGMSTFDAMRTLVRMLDKGMIRLH